ncbi:MAG: asparaginase [Hyphomicrobium sp.]
MTNPVLIEVTRGPLIEVQHRGVLAVATADGQLKVALGDVERPVFPRSAVKPMQALPLIETGAADHYGYDNGHVALACASHSGTARHVAIARDMLDRAGLAIGAMACGTHLPRDPAEQRALLLAGAEPSVLHHNCSGKHAAMLATARHLGEPTDGYWEDKHPVQARIRTALEDMTGTSLTPSVCGIDGCAVPNWALGVRHLATAFARFGTGTAAGGSGTILRARAIERVIAAMLAEPEMVAGAGRLDTRVIAAFKGAAIIKTGADGAYAGFFPKSGLGFALKIDDGAGRAAEAVAANIVLSLAGAADGIAREKTLRNPHGDTVGVIRPAADLLAALG